MTQILLLSCGDRVTTVKLMYESFARFAEKKGCQIICEDARRVTEAHIQNCDVLICVRGEMPITLEVVKKAREAGRQIIFYLDDDLKDLPKSVFRYPKRKKYLLETLRYADAFLTSNQLLAEEYLPLINGTRAFVSETSVPPEDIKPFVPKNDGTPVRFVYASSHIGEFEKYILPIWPNLVEKYGAGISLTLVGAKPDTPIRIPGATIEHVPPMNLPAYKRYMNSQDFDVGLAPLESDHFSARKYYNKFIEYSKCGICGVYSACSPYNLVVRSEENGILAENTIQGWQTALERMVEDKHLRDRCILNAQQLLRDSFSEEQIFDTLAKNLPELLNYHAPEGRTITISAKAKLEQFIFRISETAYLTVLSLKRHGIRSTWNRVKNKFRKI